MARKRYFAKYARSMGGTVHAGSSGSGSNSGWGHTVVFLGKTLYSHSASLHPVV